MKTRRIYYRKKGKSICIEGRLPNNKTCLIWTLPNADKFINQITQNASILPQEKLDKIKQKYLRLDYKTDKQSKHPSKVPLLNINGTQDKDAKPTPKDLWEMTK